MTSVSARLAQHVPAAWRRYHWIEHETVQAYFARRAGRSRGESYTTVHAPRRASNPLPANVTSRDDLPDDAGWWGYSFRDVPSRAGGETFIATLRDCHVVYYRDPARANEFHPAILNADGRALDMRELRFRPTHADVLRRCRPARRESATWIVERVYENHSHWLTAHLPKVLLLAERQQLDNVLLPPERTPLIGQSLRRLGLEPAEFETFDPTRPLHVARLTIVGSDRFRPELLRLVRDAYSGRNDSIPYRRVFISRGKASRRRLVNEAEVWRLLQHAGFERVCMEDLDFDGQVRLMRETAVLVSPHGAGLTNMLFCAPGAQIVECADLSFPNPNFYALASALNHRYWLVPALALGDCHPLEKDLQIDVDALTRVVSTLLPETRQ
jgi:hypothetical protein